MNWTDVISPSEDFRSQIGQLSMFELAANINLEKKSRLLAELVTGYGKTLLAYGVFSILNSRKLADRMLVLVPRDEQRIQFCDDVQDARKLLGIKIGRVCAVEKLEREYRFNRDGTHQVFVATYQQLNGDSYFKTLLGHGRWFIVPDECHHLGEHGQWARRQEELNAVARLFMTATKIRTDLAQLLGVPPVPDVSVTYKQAYEERVVCRVVGVIEHYHLNIIDENGKPKKIETVDLIKEGVADFEKYETKRQLRYNNAYLDWMLINPLRLLMERNLAKPGQHQMVVFAMSCRHAHHITDQINRLAKSLDYDVVADWVGVGAGHDGVIKGDKENRAVMQRFRDNRLPILVQVDKAGEGFNVKRVSILVFLHLVNSDLKILQQIGRGIRRNSALAFEHDYCAIFASADTPIASHVATMEQEARDVDGETDPDKDGSKDRACSLFDIPSLTLVEAEHDRTEHVSPTGVYQKPSEEDAAFAAKFGVPVEEVMRHYDRRSFSKACPQQPEPEFSDREQLKHAQDQVKTATKVFTGNILSLLKEIRDDFDPAWPGLVKARINAQWNRVSSRSHDQMTMEEFRLKHAWLQEQNAALRKSRRVPEWLRL